MIIFVGSVFMFVPAVVICEIALVFRKFDTFVHGVDVFPVKHQITKCFKLFSTFITQKHVVVYWVVIIHTVFHELTIGKIPVWLKCFVSISFVFY